MKHALKLAMLVALVALTSCAKKQTEIVGTILAPPGRNLDGIVVSIESAGVELTSAEVDPSSGKYRFVIKEFGVSSIKAKKGDKTAYIEQDVQFEPDEYYELDPFLAPESFYEAEIAAAQTIAEAPPPVMGSLKGKCAPEIVTVRAVSGDVVVAQGESKLGEFDFPVPVGTYDIQFIATGFTSITERNVTVSQSGQSKKLDVFLLFITTLETLDWQKGVARAEGSGDSNPNLPKAEALKGACNEAYGHAIQNLTDAILAVCIQPGKNVGDLGDDVKFKVLGITQKLPAASKKTDANGNCTVVLEYPLFGANGVTGFVRKYGRM